MESNMTTETGGPAFPHEYKYGDGTAKRFYGMDLRDYLAAKAMQAVFTGAIMDGLTMNQDIECDKLAMVAYTMADAMLKARST